MLEIILSTLALTLSVVTAWLTLFRRGRVRMTRPTMLTLTHDFVEGKGRVPKIVARALLYCTADRGAVVESMYAVIRQGEHSQSLGFWGYAEHTQVLRGGGLFVGREGVAVYHHFVSLDNTPFQLTAGDATIEIFATVLGSKSPHKLSTATVTLTEDVANLLNSKFGDAMFNLDPQSAGYRGEHRETVPKVVDYSRSRRAICLDDEDETTATDATPAAG